MSAGGSEEGVIRPLRPDEPTWPDTVWYRGWEAGYEPERGSWTGRGYAAYRGGADIDCQQADAPTWSELLDEIDAVEDDE